ncbi:MAG: phosphoribosylaminoimidazolesuccinocarboxamide synthase [Gammaproteobacteria bacterium RIFCSPLOWO2_02_FULL_56_15]|nr:MAG: phosphoribosylaminoimidazolesuccinocarboxamide synthase [Gammaproteobacteria bacterium RIFCSPLOWO2_02_FULL_56_15]
MNTTQDALYRSDLKSLKLITSGKVRDIYAVDDKHLLIVTTDRLSAFDVILPNPIPGKGAVLTALSNFWFARTAATIPNHLADIALESILQGSELEQVRGRAIIVRKMKPLPVEAIARGYIIGSGWKDYQANGAICGIRLPAGLQQAEQLPEAIFSPSSKAEIGAHDVNISYADTKRLLGPALAEKVREVSLRLYRDAAEYAKGRGIIIADTKFEFGADPQGELYLIDEVLTPDSSRFWPADSYRTGISPPSFDKQYVRDYLETLDWDKKPPGPSLPEEVIRNTAARYREAQTRLIG